MSRAQVLAALVGKPWAANGRGPDEYDCWHLAAHVERQLFGRVLPAIDVPQDVNWAWAVRAFKTVDRHPERARWREHPCPRSGLISAPDGALVLMARLDQPAHIGVWLRPESRIIHADRLGVMVDSAVELRAKGWTRLRFYAPAPPESSSAT